MKATDLMELCGVGLVLGGLWWMYPPLCLIVGGMYLVGVAVRIAGTVNLPTKGKRNASDATE